MAPRFRVTYAPLSADTDDMHAAYEQGLQTARSWFGSTLPVYVDGKSRTTGETFEVRSPVDTSIVLCRVHSATPADVADAVAAARRAAGSWATTPWQERVRLLRRAADLVSERSNELAALMSMEVGKNRLEALGDVEESADLIRYYCTQVESHGGFSFAMDTIAEHETTRSVLRPYGVWGVISPFNFPMALAAGPAGGALAAGNTIVLKPASTTPFMSYELHQIAMTAGVPAGVFNFITGGGGTAGQELIDNADVDG